MVNHTKTQIGRVCWEEREFRSEGTEASRNWHTQAAGQGPVWLCHWGGDLLWTRRALGRPGKELDLYPCVGRFLEKRGKARRGWVLAGPPRCSLKG